MTTASPTPYAVSQSLQPGRAPRTRPPIRASSIRAAQLPSASRRPHSPLSALGHSHGFSADAPALQNISIDSSDDDLPPPMAFSALTRAILEDKQSHRAHSPPARPQQQHQQHQSAYEYELPLRHHSSRNSIHKPDSSRAATPPRGTLRIRRTPPRDDREESPRVIQLSASRSSSNLRRSPSSSEGRSRSEKSSERSREGTPHELITPAPGPRVRVSSRSHGRSALTSSGTHSSKSHSSALASAGNKSDMEEHEYADAKEDHYASQGAESVHYRSKPSTDGVPGSTRVKRIPAVSGSFLRGAPMRRGALKRHNSEDDQSQAEEGHHEPAEVVPIEHDEPAVNARDFASRPASHHGSSRPSSRNGAHSSSSKGHEAADVRAQAALDRHETRRRPSQDLHESQVRSRVDSQGQPVFKMPSLPPLSSTYDQENEPPPTFKRNKQQSAGVLDHADKPAIVMEEKPVKATTGTPKAPRPALAALSNNTPMRAAPPPPKMSVLETATATAGASTVKSKKKRSHVLVNGKMFTLRGRLGKGGSSDVYRVMAENDKMFALKKVTLEDCNEDTIRGYKGEIDLLKKLEECDRVVRLFDFEVNEAKQTLSVLMEMGESDLNRIISHRLHPDDARLDLSFTRHFWKEMVECVSAVHSHDIVHSDLKPANFLLVQGRLKLIDFGIANAIDVDNTVNVHRETNVGTPNYMSPESLQDTNAGERAPGAPKLMKLGKPSDVWSLGCILYQMTYGKPPFAHIANQWNRVMAIINPKVEISYPDQGVGGVQVPNSLKRLLKRCLNRDFTQRPTLAQLLDEREPFLNPDAELDGAVPMTEDLLGQILVKVVERCRDPRRGVPTDAELRTYPKGFLDRIRAMMEKS